MVFTSHIFLFYFLPFCLLIYYVLPYRWRNLFLTVVSYIFYGWWLAIATAGIHLLSSLLWAQSYGAYVVLLQEEFGWSKTV